MKTLNKIIITKMDGRILTALMDGQRAVQLNLEEEETSILGNIYIGKVKNIIKNINSAFIDLGGGLTGYYSLTENREHIFAGCGGPACLEGQSPGPEIKTSGRVLRHGDEIVVQVSKDAVKTKDPTVTSCLSFTGRYCVVTAGRCHIGFSSKISDGKWKAQVRQALTEEMDGDFGIIIRTNAASVPMDEIIKELGQLKERCRRILTDKAYRACPGLLYEAWPSYIEILRDTYKDLMEEIITDDEHIFLKIQDYLGRYQPQDLGKVRFYKDDLFPLAKLCSIEKAVEDALARRVWLSSGGYLVVDHTEAMTVIDVNSGKYAGKKTLRETILKINLEAAREIAFQLRLRNLSGIILVDFIDMQENEDREALLAAFKSECAKDPVKTTVVDMTRLGLVEVTRKKIRKPFREQIQKGDYRR